jgi:hypothetical protein
MNEKHARRRAKALWLLGAVLTEGFAWLGVGYWESLSITGAPIGPPLSLLAEVLAVGIWAGVVSRRSSTVDGIGIGLAAFLIVFAVDVLIVGQMLSALPDKIAILQSMMIRLPLAIVGAVLGAKIGTSFRVVAADKQRYKDVSG